jgi:hypothetical protein
LGIGDWGLGIGDWGLGPIPNPQSPIPNPQSPRNEFIKINNLNIKNNYQINKLYKNKIIQNKNGR